MYNDINKIREELESDNFRIFCEELQRKIIPYEKKRQTYVGISNKSIGLGCSTILFIPVIAVIILLILLFYHFTSHPVESFSMVIKELVYIILELIIYVFFVASVLGFIGVILVGISGLLAKKYSTDLKKAVFPQLLSFIGDFRVEYSYNYIKKYIVSLSFFKRSMKNFVAPVYVTVDDYIKGFYKNRNIEIVEFEIQENRIIEYLSKTSHPIFYSGLFVKIEAPENVNLESLMPKINKIRNTTEIGTSPEYYISLDRAVYYEDGNVVICIPNYQDKFELQLQKSINDISNYKNLLNEILDIISIADDIY